MRHLTLSVTNSQQVLIGGLLARLYWHWLVIEDIFIEEDYRNEGLGAQLIQKAEALALKNNCQKAQVKTFSFQAKPFYEKLGYRVVGELQDYPPGHSLYWLEKILE
ncbi:hypothetical protein BKI52_04455 [marine bacterium AO1-C]|nr:hypothetical protein BKI52_04455 [marine bacterium AO1-C]